MQNNVNAFEDAFTRVPNDPRVLVVDGYGVSVRVNRGHLVISDGIGATRRERTLPKVESTVRRIIIVNAKGTISFEAMMWCEKVGITLTYTDFEGSPVMGTTVTAEDARLKRAQSFAGIDGPNEGLGLHITKDLITRKLKGHADNLYLIGDDKSAKRVLDCIPRVEASKTVDQCRGWEGKAAQTYWNSWIGSVEFPWSKEDDEHVPAHWKVYVSRASLESGKPRHATDPINAMLNYCYRLAEVEAVFACYATGLDPTMGFLHQDKDYRNSLALDLMEVLRPEIDRLVLDLIGGVSRLAGREFSRHEFSEGAEGVCRLMPVIKHELAEHSIQWARLLAPIVEDYAKLIASSATGYARVGKPTTDKALMAKAPKRPAKPRKALQAPVTAKPRAAHGAKPFPLKGVVTVERLVPDSVWEQVSAMLPPEKAQKTNGRPWADYRAVIAGIVCVEKLGASWARIPRNLGVSRFTCKARLDDWTASGVWREVAGVLDAYEVV